MMRPALLKAELESALGTRFPHELGIRKPAEPELLSSGVPEVDSAIAGLPRGGITEVCGPASSGRTSLLLSVLSEATRRGEVCALVDTTDALDPVSASHAGVDLDQLLWIRCGGNAEHALKAVDLVVHAGGFGVVAMDIADIRPEIANRIPLSHWFRLRRAIEKTPTILMVLEQRPNARTCASLIVEMEQRKARWSGVPGCSQLLRGTDVHLVPRKPPRLAAASFAAEMWEAGGG